MEQEDRRPVDVESWSQRVEPRIDLGRRDAACFESVGQHAVRRERFLQGVPDASAVSFAAHYMRPEAWSEMDERRLVGELPLKPAQFLNELRAVAGKERLSHPIAHNRPQSFVMLPVASDDRALGVVDDER